LIVVRHRGGGRYTRNSHRTDVVADPPMTPETKIASTSPRQTKKKKAMAMKMKLRIFESPPPQRKCKDYTAKQKNLDLFLPMLVPVTTF